MSELNELLEEVSMAYAGDGRILAIEGMVAELEADEERLRAKNQSQKKEIEGLHELLGEVDELLQNCMFTGYEDMAVRDKVHNVCTYLAARRRATGEGKA